MKKEIKKIFSSAFTLTGTIIGAGVLGIPFVFSKAGFFVGLFWIFLLGFLVLIINLYLGEITLRTKKIYQLPGYVGKYLGKKGRKLMSIFLIFGIYSALLAYLIGEGQSLSKLFFDNLNYSLFFGILFWAGITLLLQKSSVKKLESFEFYGVLFIIFLTILAFFVLLPNINLNNILEPPEKDFFNFFIPFGVILFSFLGFNAIPELRMEVGKKTKLLKKAIIAGTLVPVFIYILFSFSVIGFLGNNVSEVATLSFDGFLGKLLYLLGIFTMGSSFFVLSFCLRDYFILDLGRCEKSKLSFFYVSILPLILYILIDFFNLAGFAKILGVGGTVSGGMMGILIILTNFFSKKKGERNPEYSLKINWPIIIFFILLFTLGVLFEIFLI